jgi:hypothetical protein
MTRLTRAQRWRRFREQIDYHPDQPRAPAGSPDGGQWTSGEGAPNRPHEVSRGQVMKAGREKKKKDKRYFQQGILWPKGIGPPTGDPMSARKLRGH